MEEPTFPVGRKHFLGQGARLWGPNPGASAVGLAVAPGGAWGGHSSPPAGIRLVPVPGSCRQALSSANDFRSHTKSIK